MPKRPTDPTAALRKQAAKLEGATEGASCTQTSFKRGKTAFLYVGPQGGRFKAMFKLDDSMPEARRMADEQPDRFDVGKTAWVTARFSADDPLPKPLWQRWLKESHALAAGKARRR